MAAVVKTYSCLDCQHYLVNTSVETQDAGYCTKYAPTNFSEDQSPGIGDASMFAPIWDPAGGWCGDYKKSQDPKPSYCPDEQNN